MQFVFLIICISVTWGQVRFVSLHYKPTYGENIEMRFALSKRVKTIQFFQDYGRLSHLWWSRCHLLTRGSEKVIRGHVRSSIVYWPLITIRWCQRLVSWTKMLAWSNDLFDMQHIYHPCPYWVMTWHRHKVQVWIDLWMSSRTCFNSSWREKKKHNGAHPMSLSF